MSKPQGTYFRAELEGMAREAERMDMTRAPEVGCEERTAFERGFHMGAIWARLWMVRRENAREKGRQDEK